MKKIISLCLALCMFFALAIPAGAANVEESTDRLTTVGELDSAYVDNDTDLMNYDGENITENLPKSTTGMIDESSISLAAVDDVTVLKGSALFAEKGVGATTMHFLVIVMPIAKLLQTSNCLLASKTTMAPETAIFPSEFMVPSMGSTWVWGMKGMAGILASMM